MVNNNNGLPKLYERKAPLYLWRVGGSFLVDKGECMSSISNRVVKSLAEGNRENERAYVLEVLHAVTNIDEQGVGRRNVWHCVKEELQVLSSTLETIRGAT